MRRRTFAARAFFAALMLSGLVLLTGYGRLDAADLMNGHPAKIILGQPDLFRSYASYPRENAPDGMAGPNNLACLASSGHVTVTDRRVFGSEKIVIPDRKNHRALVFNSVPTANFANADLVLGQPDFVSTAVNQGNADAAPNTLSQPMGAAVTPTGQLVLTDRANHRVLIFNTFPTTSNAPANVVLGQMNFSDHSNALGPNRLENPEDVAVFGTAIAVVDRNNSRIVIWKDIRPGMVSNGQNADIVLGQKDLTSKVTDVVDRKTLREPRGVTFGPAGQLVVGCPFQNRVLIWNTFPPVSGSEADIVLGQPSFTTDGAGATASGMDQPHGVAVGNGGRLAVADRNNNRVMIWRAFPTMNHQPCDIILQGPMVDDATTIGQPSGLEWNADDHLYVMSGGGNYVKIFDPAYTTNRTPPPPLAVPMDFWAAAGDTIALPVVPGTGIPPYRWTQIGPMVGTFDAMTGNYIAALPNIHDQTNNGPVMFEVKDHLETKATLPVRVYPPVRISLNDSVAYSGRIVNVSVWGGVNPQSGPWTCSFVANASGGTLEDSGYPSAKAYTPGPTFGVTDIIAVKDVAGHEARFSVQVKEPLQLLMGDPPRPAPWIDSPDTLSMKVGESVIFSARGGIGPPYVYGCYESYSGMSRIERIDDLSARYTPLRPGIDRVYVNDTKYNAFTTAPIRITGYGKY